MTRPECGRWKAEVGAELGAASVAAAGSERRHDGRGGCGEREGGPGARGGRGAGDGAGWAGAVRPGRRGAAASCGRGLARRFRPPRRGVSRLPPERGGRAAGRARGCLEVGAEAAGGAAASGSCRKRERSLGPRDEEA